MTPYKRSAGESGVVAYQIGKESIAVQFNSREIYLYTYATAGKANVEHMKVLARSGQGLSTYISRVVRHGYAARRRPAELTRRR
jgi:hypothetical protein